MHAEERLRVWLLSNHRSATAIELRAFFDVGVGELSRECHEAMTFALAVLRDIYADDEDVGRWLAAPRHGFDGASATDLLRRGDGSVVTAALARAWHESWRSASREDTIDFMLTPTS